jgi:predicted MFS family arabinose efflux permease
LKAWLELRRLPRRVWILSAAALINRAGTMALPFLTLYLTRKLGWSAPRAAFIVTLYGAVALIAAPASGKLCDFLGTRRVMVWSLALAGVFMCLFPLVASFPQVVALTVAWSLANEAFRPANMTAISESVTPAMTKPAFALHRAAVNLGFSVGPAVGGVLAAVSFPAIWLSDGATSLASAALLAAALGDAPRAGTEPSSKTSTAGLRDARLLLCLAAVVLMSSAFFQHEAALPLHLVSMLGFSTQFYGLLFTLNTALIVAFEIPINHATAHWPHRRTLVVGSLLFAAGLGGYAFCAARWHAMLATGVWTFGEMVLMPGMTAYVASLAPESRRGEYMGLYMMAFACGFMLGPWAGVSLLESRGPVALWGATALICCAGAAVFSLTREEL